MRSMNARRLEGLRRHTAATNRNRASNSWRSRGVLGKSNTSSRKNSGSVTARDFMPAAAACRCAQHIQWYETHCVPHCTHRICALKKSAKKGAKFFVDLYIERSNGQLSSAQIPFQIWSAA
jgi:hypothetical protein